MKIPRLRPSLGGDFPSLAIVMFVPSQRDSAVACERLTLLASDQMHLFSVLIMAFVSFNILLFSKVLF